MFDRLKTRGFDVLAVHHAEAIITHDMPEAEEELESVLLDLNIPVTEIVSGGGGEAQSTQRMRNALAELGWKKATVEVKKTVNGREVVALSHEIDHVRSFGPDNWIFALEIEWNNKDPFFDRDLENFKRLHGEGAVSVGGLITRGQSLQTNMRQLLRRFADEAGIDSLDALDAYGYSPTRRQRDMIEKRFERTGDFRQAWVDMFVGDKFGEATTHWRKLQDRVMRGVGNPCPLVLIGIPDRVVTFSDLTTS
jgi:hypothetical protein